MLRPEGSAVDTVRARQALDEPELVRRAQLGSAAAFEELVVGRGPALHRFLVARLRDQGDVRDALQETLLAAWQGLPSLRDRERFWPWLAGIAAHKAADTIRRRTPVAGAAELELVAGVDDEHVHEAREVWRLVDSLPGAQREILFLRYLLELSEEEVAAALGIRLGTVKSRSARARRALEGLMR